MTRPVQVAVLGGGSWGTTVASLAAPNASTTLWARDAQTVADVNEHHRNSRYLGDLELHPSLRATGSLEEAVWDADVVVMGVPSHAVRATLREIAPLLRHWVPIVSLTKGLEQGTRMRMTEVIEEELPGRPAGVLAGPNLAKEVLSGYAAAAVIAMPAADLHQPALPGVHEPRCGRLRTRWSVEERHRHRSRDGRGPQRG